MDENRGKIAFDIHKQIELNERSRRLLLAENARLLSDILDNEYYKELLGDEEGQWAGYLGQLELFYTRNQVYTYARVYKKLTQELGVDPSVWVDVPITRLSDCLPVITASNYPDWFASAVSLTARDWKIQLEKAKGKITEEDEHEHNNVIYEICKICGKRHQLTASELTHLNDPEGHTGGDKER